MATFTQRSFGKVNLVLNVLGRRDDGFHELETLMHPVRCYDEVTFEKAEAGIFLTCSDPALPVDSSNLVYRAAELFLRTAGIGMGARIHLEKTIPMAAGLGGGSGNAAATLRGLNEIFDRPLDEQGMQALAAALGSDVPFFLQENPAVARGRGERVEPLGPLGAMQDAAFLLLRPGFGVATAWAYQALAGYPDLLHGEPGRADALARALQTGPLSTKVQAGFFNSLEEPVFEKFPLLALMKEYLLREGAVAALMSGSGSTIFAVLPSLGAAKELEERVQKVYGPLWTYTAEVGYFTSMTR